MKVYGQIENMKLLLNMEKKLQNQAFMVEINMNFLAPTVTTTVK
jgi:hypothetical protein